MAVIKRVKKVYLFETGNLSVFDETGQRIPELEGPYSIDKHKRILLEAADDLKFEGQHILPFGFIKTAWEWSAHFREKGIAWEEAKDQFLTA